MFIKIEQHDSNLDEQIKSYRDNHALATVNPGRMMLQSNSYRPSIKPFILNLKGEIKKNNSSMSFTWVPKLGRLPNLPFHPVGLGGL